MKDFACHKRVKAAQIRLFCVEKTDQDHGYVILDDGNIVKLDVLANWHRPDYTPVIGDYIVEYEGGYRSISPQKVFEDGYETVESGHKAFGFDTALRLIKDGKRVAREGWNGKNMFVFLVNGVVFKVNRPPLLGIYSHGTEINYLPHIDMRTADGKIVPWLASQTDLLAHDWGVVE